MAQQLEKEFLTINWGRVAGAIILPLAAATMIIIALYGKGYSIADLPDIVLYGAWPLKGVLSFFIGGVGWIALYTKPALTLMLKRRPYAIRDRVYFAGNSNYATDEIVVQEESYLGYKSVVVRTRDGVDLFKTFANFVSREDEHA